MSELNTPVGDSAPVIDAPVDTTPLTEREAADALSQRRWKQDAEAKRQAAAPEPAAPPDTPPTEEAAPAEEATGEEAPETTEPAEELPPIEPPRSWTKDEKEEFKSYPREAQEKIARREQDRETALRRGQNETAEQRKETESLREKLNEALQRYEQATQNALQTVQQGIAGEFADIRTHEDITKLSKEDPLRFIQYQAHLTNVQKIQNDAKEAQEQVQKQYHAKWSEFASKEDAKFLEMAPEMSDKATATKIADASVSLLKGVNFTDQDLAKLWNGEASVSLRDHRLQLILLKAAKYDEAQKSAPKKIAAKPVPAVQKPGVAKPKGSDDDARITSLEKELERTGSDKVAAQLLLARRAARR